MSHRWIVYTPNFTVTERILDDGTGPSYDIADAIEIEAKTKRDAIALGVKAMLDGREYEYCRSQREEGLCPYTGVKAMGFYSSGIAIPA